MKEGEEGYGLLCLEILGHTNPQIVPIPDSGGECESLLSIFLYKLYGFKHFGV